MIVIAAAVSLGRVLIEIAAVAPGGFASMAFPLLAILGVVAIIALAIFWFQQARETQMPEQRNPAELKTAFLFAAAYGVVLLAVAAAKEHFGSAGLYVVAAVSGLTDMDAITLSCARLVESSRLAASTGWRAILLAATSNFVFKIGTVALLGHRLLALQISATFGFVLVCGGLILWLWPA